MASVILGEWTHRRGDRGGLRAVAAEIERPRPSVAWTWRPDHDGHVDQVRIVGPHVLVATMMPRDLSAPGWEHAVVYTLDARNGAVLARRVLPDPVPVAAMVVEAGLLHIVATRRGEPIFWYALTPADLVPQHRRIVPVATRHEDVLEAWAAPDGGLWLELEVAVAPEAPHALAYVFVGADGTAAALWPRQESRGEGAPAARDAFAGGHELFAPVDGRWTRDPLPPALSRLRPGADEHPGWVSATVVGPRAQIHALGGEDVVCAVAIAEDPERPDRARVEAFSVDRHSGDVQWRAQAERVELRKPLGEAARIARRQNGEILFQSLGPSGSPSSPLLCARPDGKLDVIALGTGGRYVLDAALGGLVLVHRSNKEGRVEVGGFDIDHEGRLLGRRGALQWKIDAGDLGSGTTVYAGAGTVLVRGTRAVSALTL